MEELINKLSEEEKKAIEILKNEDKEIFKLEGPVAVFKKKQATEIVLNLIKKQQEQLQGKDKIIELMAIDLINAPIRIIKGDIFKFTNKEDTIEYFTKKTREV